MKYRVRQDDLVTAELDLPGIVDPHFERAFAAGVAPGVAYGVVQDQRLVYANGLGTIDLEAQGAQAPDAQTVFSIASMTKSFTAATVLSLRESGLLELDRPVATYLPELAREGWIGEVTVRHLLTMAGGFVTDDPWGDRQQSLAADQFRQLLGVLTPQWAPGRYFEYSNLGYAILGCVIEAVTGDRYPDVVRERVLEPAGLVNSGYHQGELAGRTIATGYVLRGSKFASEPIADCGAFAPMGGLLSTVEDIARWVSLMLAAESGDPTPPELPGRLLREMQTGQRFIEGAALPNEESIQPTLEARHYGFGLMEERLSWGRSIAHSGGYPGLRLAHAMAPGKRVRHRGDGQSDVRPNVDGSHGGARGSGGTLVGTVETVSRRLDSSRGCPRNRYERCDVSPQ